MRTLIDIPGHQIQSLAELGARSNRPRAALIREAIAEYLARRVSPDDAEAFGLWGTATTDGLAYQEKARAEW